MTWVRNHHKASLVLLTAISLPLTALAQEYREIGRTTEKELKVVLSSSFGSLHVFRGDPGKVLTLENTKLNAIGFNVDYAIRNRIGYMDLALGENDEEGDNGDHPHFKFNGFKGGQWSLSFSDAIPISFDIEMGVGKGDLNLSGLSVKDLNLSTGASDVCLAFDEPNRTSIENINVESGVSNFLGRNLGNANFRHFRFQGGVGSCVLDFGGEITREVDVDVAVGMGVMTLIIPKDVGARVLYEKNWVSRVTCSDDFDASGETEFVSKNYSTAEGKMNIRVDSGVGNVRIEREE